ncbi:hypothetical protein D3C71_1091530 [compost metagenome]
MLGTFAQGIQRDTVFVHQRGIAKQQLPAIHHALHTHAGQGIEIVHAGQRHPARVCFGHDRGRQRMLAALVQAGRPLQDLIGSEGRHRLHVAERWPALGQRAGLVDHQRVDLAQCFDRLGIAEQHPVLRGATGGDHDRHRCGQPQCARAGDDQHRYRAQYRMRP